MSAEKEGAMYPFLNKVVELVDIWSLTAKKILDPFYMSALDRAEQRVSQAILKGETEVDLENYLDELLSFPIANMFVRVIDDDFLDRRYALSEAVRATSILTEEKEDFITALARVEFNWNIRGIEGNVDNLIYKFELHFKDYVRNAAEIRDVKWKLINKRMKQGYVPLTRQEVVRLLQEEIKRRIYDVVSQHASINLPEPLKERVNRLTKLLKENRPSLTGDGLPAQVVHDALPPCIKHAFDGLLAGRRAGHMERFALTSFLISAGMEVDDIVKLFVSVTDFDEGFTRYQIEHIAGLRGGRTRYTPPKCATLRTHGVCYEPDEGCQYVNHPLTYYRRKVNDVLQEQEAQNEE